MSDHHTSLWRNRDYLFLISGQAISSMGTEVSDLAYILLVLALTGSPAQVGFVGALEAAPVLILSMPVALAATLNAHVRNAPPAVKAQLE